MDVVIVEMIERTEVDSEFNEENFKPTAEVKRV